MPDFLSGVLAGLAGRNPATAVKRLARIPWPTVEARCLSSLGSRPQASARVGQAGDFSPELIRTSIGNLLRPSAGVTLWAERLLKVACSEAVDSPADSLDFADGGAYELSESEVLYRIALALERTHTHLALSCFLVTSLSFPDPARRPYAMCGYARAMAQCGEGAAVKDVFSEIRKRGGRYPFAVEEGSCLADAGDHVSAEAVLTAATARNPEEAWAWYRLGSLYLETRKPREARTAYAEYLQRVPADVPALFNYASACIALGDRDEAYAKLTRAHQLDPGDTAVISNLVALLDERGEGERARELLEGAYEGNPSDPLLVSRLARRAREHGNEEEFLEWREVLGVIDAGELKQLPEEFGVGD